MATEPVKTSKYVLSLLQDQTTAAVVQENAYSVCDSGLPAAVALIEVKIKCFKIISMRLRLPAATPV
jgi:hypothetical protein